MLPCLFLAKALDACSYSRLETIRCFFLMSHLLASLGAQPATMQFQYATQILSNDCSLRLFGRILTQQPNVAVECKRDTNWDGNAKKALLLLLASVHVSVPPINVIPLDLFDSPASSAAASPLTASVAPSPALPPKPKAVGSAKSMPASASVHPDLPDLQKSSGFPFRSAPLDRKATWLYLINWGRDEPLQNGYSTKLQAGPCDSAYMSAIAKDVPRTFPQHAFVQSEAGQASLTRLLIALAREMPSITYCQVHFCCLF